MREEIAKGRRYGWSNALIALSSILNQNAYSFFTPSASKGITIAISGTAALATPSVERFVTAKGGRRVDK